MLFLKKLCFLNKISKNIRFFVFLSTFGQDTKIEPPHLTRQGREPNRVT